MIKTICSGHRNIWVQVLALLPSWFVPWTDFFSSLRFSVLFFNRRVRGVLGPFCQPRVCLPLCDGSVARCMRWRDPMGLYWGCGGVGNGINSPCLAPHTHGKPVEESQGSPEERGQS